MKTLIVSEPTLVVGNSIEEVKEGLFLLREYIQSGNSLIYLTNRPSDCITPVGGVVSIDGSVSFKYAAKQKEALGLEVLIEQEKNNINLGDLQYNYAVFGNGALIFDAFDKLIYERYLEKDIIEEVTKILIKNGYADNPNPIFLQIAQQAFIKYYKSNIGVLEKKESSKIYGFQGYIPSSIRRNDVANEQLCQLLETSDLGLKAWVLNNMPCIYNAASSKEIAIEWLISNKLIDPNDMRLIVGEITDLGLSEAYPELTYVVDSNENFLQGIRKEKSLVKVLEKIL
jgi:hypothetical protein